MISPEVRDALNQRWAEITNDGQLDDSVGRAERMFDVMHEKLRERFNPGEEALHSINVARRLVTDQIKRDVVMRHDHAQHWNRREVEDLRSTVRLLRSKLDGTAIATDTVLGGLCDEALKLLGQWADCECNHWDLRKRTRALLTTPRVPK